VSVDRSGTIWAGIRKGDAPVDAADITYVCQSTEIANASQPLKWSDFSQYVEDYTSGNARLSAIASTGIFFVFQQFVSAGMGLGAPLRWMYDQFQKLRGGTPYPWRFGKIPQGARTPNVDLGLKPGELVKIKSYDEILATLDEGLLNRGMCFDAEMVPFCGGTYKVLDRINTIINEKTGKMQHLKNECIMLENVVCKACYAKYRAFCPRSIFPYWREIWLERVKPGQASATNS
jgi:hypothetical protein